MLVYGRISNWEQPCEQLVGGSIHASQIRYTCPTRCRHTRSSKCGVILGGLSMEKSKSSISSSAGTVRFPRSFVLLSALAAIVLSGCVARTVVPPPTPPPTPAPVSVTLTVTPSAVQPGQSATLSWSSQYALACTASDSWSGAQPQSGSVNVMLTGPKAAAYTLACTGQGTPATNTVTLAVAPPETACAVKPAIVKRAGRRTARRQKSLSGSHS